MLIFALVTALRYQFGSFPALITQGMFPALVTRFMFSRSSPVADSTEKRHFSVKVASFPALANHCMFSDLSLTLDIASFTS